MKTKIRTFLDAGVVMAFAKTEHPDFKRAYALVNDPRRVFASSVYIELETITKARYEKHQRQIAAYEDYFRGLVKYFPKTPTKVLALAFQVCSQYGLNGMDALHIAAALLTECDEFLTTEEPKKSIYRARPLIKVTTF
jgi:predicted nucleic acid-binding protein